SPVLSRDEFVHTACYCEENVYHLIRQLRAVPSALFISNPARLAPVWCQRASSRPDGLVFWDYHVVAIDGSQNPPLVYDLDSKLDFPCSLPLYFEHALRPNSLVDQLLARPMSERPGRLHRRYRLVSGQNLMRHFASDRRHMRHKSTGAWLAPPPAYPCIRGPWADSDHNLPRYLDMGADDFAADAADAADDDEEVAASAAIDGRFGKLLTESELLAEFALA
ncbi:hypothetical protein BOX15_Mlig008920g1, partial [Macrostomum lignano]